MTGEDMRKITAIVFVFLTLFPASSQALPVQAQVDDVTYKQERQDVYTVTANVKNTVHETREFVLRAQLTFYDTASPAGDLPAAVLRKDITVVLRGGGERKVAVTLINEGRMPRGSYRIVPMLRVRRERAFQY